MHEQILETKHATYRITGGVMHIVYPPNLVIYQEVAKQIVENRLKLAAGRTLPLFFDIRGLVSIDTPSRKYFATPGAVELISAGAFMIESLFSRLAGNIFIKIDKPLIPTKLFTDKEKALLWLENYK